MSTQIKNDMLQVLIHDKGGELGSIKDYTGLEYLWQGDARYWSGQSPVLFPICGSLRDNTATLQDGRVVKMPRHGIVRKREFVLTDSSEEHAVYTFYSDEETKSQYPFDFKLEVHYQLVHTKLVITYTVTNTDTKVLPFTLGAHPGFRCPLHEGQVYEDYELLFEQKETLSRPYQVTETGLVDRTKLTPFLNQEDRIPLTHALFKQDAVALCKLKSKKVKLIHQKTHKGVEVQFPDFEHLVIWGFVQGGDFVAIEPWSGMSTYTEESDIFEEKEFMKFLKPFESYRFELGIQILL